MNTRLQTIIAAAALLGGSIVSLCQTYRLDPDFAPVPAKHGGSIDVIALQSDGKLLVGGDFHLVNGEIRVHLARLEPDGSLDPSLNLGTGFTGGSRGYSGAPARYLQGLLIQPDGKILLSGGFKEVNGILKPGLARLLSNGQLDHSFRPVVEGFVARVFLRPDGKLVIAGNFSQVNGEKLPGLAQLNPDGTLDSAFAPVTPTNPGEFYSHIGLQPNGKLVAVLEVVYGEPRFRRFNTDGSIDLEFTSSFKGPVLGVTPEGEIILRGVDNIVRLGIDGKLDPSYAPNIREIFPRFLHLDTIRMLSDGSILVSVGLGEELNRDRLKEFGFVHLLQDGTVDRRLNDGQAILSDRPAFPDPDPYRDVAVLDSKGGLVVNRRDEQGFPGSDLLRLKPDGTRDGAFHPLVEAVRHFFRVAALPDDSLIVVADRHARQTLIKLRADGSVEAGFSEQFEKSTSAFPPGALLKTLATTPDGKILLGFSFGELSGELLRLNSDATVDSTFNAPAGLMSKDWYLQSLLVEKDGQILVQIAKKNPVQYYESQIIRLDRTGETELARVALPFVAGGMLAVQTDGKVLVNIFVPAKGEGSIARLNRDGSLDSSFPWTPEQPSGNAAVILPDGRILVAGLPVTGPIEGNRTGLALLHTDGSLEKELVSDLRVRGEAAGLFGDASSWTGSLALQTDGRVVVGGDFISINGSVRLGLARLVPEFASRLSRPRIANATFQLAVDAPPGRTLVVEATRSLTPADWQPISTNSVTLSPLTITDPDGAKFPQRFYRAISR